MQAQQTRATEKSKWQIDSAILAPVSIGATNYDQLVLIRQRRHMRCLSIGDLMYGCEVGRHSYAA